MRLLVRIPHLVADFIHRNLLLCLLACYGAAIFFPHVGIALRGIRLHGFSMVEMMLALLLFNAGLNADPSELKKAIKRPKLILAALLLNFLLPIFSAGLIALGGTFWHNPEEIQILMTGLALVAAMPIAGSSTAWAQNANGNLALSLGLVVASTLLSPLLTPFVFKAFAVLTHGDYSEDLVELATKGSVSFIWTTVVIPSVLGILTRTILGSRRAVAVKKVLASVNRVNLLALNYSNAAVSLPQAFAQPDYDFLILVLIATTVFCFFAFTSGWLIAKKGKASRSETVSLIFGLGMNNNGTGLILATKELADHPLILLPIIVYNLIQQIAAGIVDRKYRSSV